MTEKYIDFEAYERVAEPHKRERASTWRTAIGLQDVDGLKVSDYLKQTAVKHIEAISDGHAPPTFLTCSTPTALPSISMQHKKIQEAAPLLFSLMIR